MKRRNHIAVVPVWHEQIDLGLYVLALLAFVEQLAEEATPNESDRVSVKAAGDDGKEGARD